MTPEPYPGIAPVLADADAWTRWQRLYATDTGFGHEHGHVNGALIRQFGPRNQLDIPALEQMRDYLARWLSDG